MLRVALGQAWSHQTATYVVTTARFADGNVKHSALRASKPRRSATISNDPGETSTDSGVDVEFGVVKTEKEDELRLETAMSPDSTDR